MSGEHKDVALFFVEELSGMLIQEKKLVSLFVEDVPKLSVLENK